MTPDARPGETRAVQVATTEEEVLDCWPALRELRPHLKSAQELVDRWKKQCGETYQIAYVREQGKVTAAAGYRIMHTLSWGRTLYIDDLVAVQTSHKKGLGTLLLKHLQEEARKLDCDAVHLDTGYQRHLAHLAYLRNGFKMIAHHMAWLPERE